MCWGSFAIGGVAMYGLLSLMAFIVRWHDRVQLRKLIDASGNTTGRAQ